MPATCGSDSATACSLADAPGALEPDGMVLVAASSGFGNAPTHFFEFTPTNTVSQVSDPVAHSGNSGAYYYNFMVLPNGQVLMTDFSSSAEVYTPAGAPVAAWAPIVKKVASRLTRGVSYTVTGKRLSGVSQGAYYGDDAQAATNYPIVKIVNGATGHVTYARSLNFALMTVDPAAKTNSADFVLPASTETGPSTLYVVANGIASAPVSVRVN
jgi:hypothetical protein